MDWQGWLALAVVAGIIWSLTRDWLGPDVVMCVGLVPFLLTGILSVKEALLGFGNEGMLTVAALFVVAQAVKDSGRLEHFAAAVLGRSNGAFFRMARLLLPTCGLSAFMNNTPVVAMLTPVVRQWARRRGLSPSKFLIPLSYASILGGMCTLIGTSTNLVVSGLMVDFGYPALGMFEITRVGLPCALVGLGFMMMIGRHLLPQRRDVSEELAETRREYLVEMVVRPSCPLVGKTVEQAGLRHLSGLFLVHIERQGHVIGPVTPEEPLQAGDHLLFTGLISTIVELKQIRGLAAVAEPHLEVQTGPAHDEIQLFEVVVSHASPLVGTGIRAGGFRRLYDAAVIAVHRSGQRIESKIGDIILRPGDTLLLEAKRSFTDKWNNTRDFYLVSQVAEEGGVKSAGKPWALLVMTGMIIFPSLQLVPMVVSALTAAILMILLRIVSPARARASLNLPVLITIAAALGVGRALEKSGLADAMAQLVIDATTQVGPLAALAALFLVTSLFTEIITNNAAAALVFPVALSTAQQLHVDPRAFFIAVAIAASASFATPLGYQTNLIVFGPGGYRFRDFLRVGLPMNLLVLLTGVVAVACWWPVL
ncbi:MAG: SLC13 family permease [Acidobacteria bacterium]|nr:SLC13 family permease [Acidobacteriota bacterium]